MWGPSYLGLTRSISWLLTSPEHQQPWYWLCSIGRFLSYLRKDKSTTCVISMWRYDTKCKYMFMFSQKNLARKGLSYRACSSATNVGTTILVPCHVIKSLTLTEHEAVPSISSIDAKTLNQLQYFWLEAARASKSLVHLVLSMGHTLWSCLIRCVKMKWIWQVLEKIQSAHDSAQRWTDGRSSWSRYTPTPFNFVEARAIISMGLKNLFESTWLEGITGDPLHNLTKLHTT